MYALKIKSVYKNSPKVTFYYHTRIFHRKINKNSNFPLFFSQQINIISGEFYLLFLTLRVSCMSSILHGCILSYTWNLKPKSNSLGLTPLPCPLLDVNTCIVSQVLKATVCRLPPCSSSWLHHTPPLRCVWEVITKHYSLYFSNNKHKNS